MHEKVLEYLKSQNIEISLKTKARGHLGFYTKGKIAISKNIPKEKLVQILLHEYTHKIHSEIEKNNFNKGGTLEFLFDIQDVSQITRELLRVTHFVDENSLFLKFQEPLRKFEKEIKELENQIKRQYPDFKKSKKFEAFETYLKKTKSKAKYFLKYDHIKIVTPIFRKTEFYSINTLEEDFPELGENFKNYIKLLSVYRKCKKLKNRIAKMKRYYKKPTELFARFIEGLVIDYDTTVKIAPSAYNHFIMLLKAGRYSDLENILKLLLPNI
ncbi:MAG: hypothetical protein PHX18_00355 [Candidatus Gastranaerophilales bacterium]|nr:hypothetical protein [Candidatus Gastranaerophilales bacterium]